MNKRFKKISWETLGLFILLALTAFIVPKNIMDLPRFWFMLLVGLYIYLWYKILKRLWYQLNDNDPKDNWDFLIYDLIYILGLPIIFNIIMLKVGRGLFEDPFWFYAYYGFVGIIVLMKFILMASKSKHYYVFRYAITMLFILGNLIVVNQILNMWYGLNFMGQGF